MADSSITLVSSAAAAGVGVSFLSDFSILFAAFPIFPFALIGMIGGLAGFGLAMERGGALDHSSAREIFCFLARRMLIGACIGVAVGLWWSDGKDNTNRGLWMLLTGLASTAPVEILRGAIDLAMVLVKSRLGKTP